MNDRDVGDDAALHHIAFPVEFALFLAFGDGRAGAGLGEERRNTGAAGADAFGERYIMETGLVADLALVHAWKGDTEGNLVYRKTARNFNPMMATAGRITVAEVEHLVEPGELDGDMIHTPGVYVQRIIHTTAEKRIEQRTLRKRPEKVAYGAGEEV